MSRRVVRLFRHRRTGGQGRQLLALLTLAAAGLAFAACGGDDGTNAYGESNAVTLDDASVTVEMSELMFQPQGIRVKQGTTVTWINDDAVVHNVRQVESAFLSPDIGPGQSFTTTMDKPGRYRYQCTYHHPNMNGVVIVEEG